MDVFACYHRRTATFLSRWARDNLLAGDLDPGLFTASPPPADAGCDIVVDAALVYGSTATSLAWGRLDLARAIAQDLAAAPPSEAVVVAGPGFVNVTLRPSVILEAVASVLRDGPAVGEGARVGAGAFPAGLSFEEARARVAADQIAALLAAAKRPPLLLRRAPGARGPAILRRGRAVAARGADDLAGLAADGFRFAVASRRPDAALHLDPAALSDRSRDNPAFWIPYAAARLSGVFRRAAAVLPDIDLAPAALAGTDLSVLTDPGEIALARLVIRHAHVVASAAASASPQRLATYLDALAAAVHSQWNRSKDQPQLRFVNEEERALTKARLGLALASLLVLKSGLGILGVNAPDEMR